MKKRLLSIGKETVNKNLATQSVKCLHRYPEGHESRSSICINEVLFINTTFENQTIKAGFLQAVPGVQIVENQGLVAYRGKNIASPDGRG